MNVMTMQITNSITTLATTVMYLNVVVYVAHNEAELERELRGSGAPGDGRGEGGLNSGRLRKKCPYTRYFSRHCNYPLPEILKMIGYSAPEILPISE